ncbi:hypothetical protein GOQ29_03125 [Clostridium sp. D2Q-14]|uniref:hypothetical protein n=1 Tax=Anaeromonas gelatinilytica TaxID=2683194 RepID=UPI00193B6A90|nr:hypothetical protein [Anaeromonas gelatinilytica]MBS4534601.1 hypothetical protein [Anaeromonas gelatinilytica]
MDKNNNDVSINSSNHNEDEKKKDLSKLVDKFKSTVNAREEDIEKLRDLADKYSGKSEDELYLEIMNLNKKLSQGENKEEFMKKLKKLDKLRPMLNESQNKKLNKLMEILKADID